MSTQVVKVMKINYAAIDTARRAFKMFPIYLEDELKKAVTKLVLIIERRAKELCPADTGLLKSSITPVVQEWYWGYVGTNVEYAAHVEYGTDPHTISATNAKVLMSEKGDVFGKTVKHPGTKAQPYFEPAFLEGKNQATKVFNTAFKRALRRAHKG